jgi:hypothetical protein
MLTDDLAPAVKAYGLLWRSAAKDHHVFEARHLLLNSLTPEQRKAGITWARATYGPMTDAEVMSADIRCG